MGNIARQVYLKMCYVIQKYTQSYKYKNFNTFPC
jgi:hypothetical protein